MLIKDLPEDVRDDWADSMRRDLFKGMDICFSGAGDIKKVLKFFGMQGYIKPLECQPCYTEVKNEGAALMALALQILPKEETFTQAQARAYPVEIRKELATLFVKAYPRAALNDRTTYAPNHVPEHECLRMRYLASVFSRTIDSLDYAMVDGMATRGFQKYFRENTKVPQVWEDDMAAHQKRMMELPATPTDASLRKAQFAYGCAMLDRFSTEGMHDLVRMVANTDPCEPHTSRDYQCQAAILWLFRMKDEVSVDERRAVSVRINQLGELPSAQTPPPQRTLQTKEMFSSRFLGFFEPDSELYRKFLMTKVVCGVLQGMEHPMKKASVAGDALEVLKDLGKYTIEQRTALTEALASKGIKGSAYEYFSGIVDSEKMRQEMS